MPNTRSAKKRDRQANGRQDHNKEKRSTLRTAIKRARQTEGDGREAALREAEQLIDRAARKRLIHPNKAARTKARLRKAATS